jgi:PIN domain nuclease of toxin-antitoxin system
MKLLLDTHAFIWWASESERLSERVRILLADGQNALYFSVASAWEIQIKVQIGKLNTDEPLSLTISKQQKRNNLRLIAVTLEHALAIEQLPMHHKDPFDRLLIAQARVENLTLVTHDSILTQYPIKTIW